MDHILDTWKVYRTITTSPDWPVDTSGYNPASTGADRLVARMLTKDGAAIPPILIGERPKGSLISFRFRMPSNVTSPVVGFNIFGAYKDDIMTPRIMKCTGFVLSSFPGSGSTLYISSVTTPTVLWPSLATVIPSAAETTNPYVWSFNPLGLERLWVGLDSLSVSTGTVSFTIEYCYQGCIY